MREIPRELKVGLGSFITVAVPFFALMGYYTPRLSWELAPPILIIIAWTLNSLAKSMPPRQKRLANGALIALSISYTVGIVVLNQTYFLVDKTVTTFTVSPLRGA
jgi:hypothetical protein